MKKLQYLSCFVFYQGRSANYQNTKGPFASHEELGAGCHRKFNFFPGKLKYCIKSIHIF